MGIELKYSIEQKLKSAKEYESSGLNLHAVQIYYKIINENPSYAEANFLLAELFEKQGNIISAKNILSDYLELNPDDTFFRISFAKFLMRYSFWEDVIEVIQPIDINEEPVAAFFLGYSYYKLKDYNLAKINFQHFIKSGIKEELLQETYIYLAKTEIELKNFESALHYAKESEMVYSNSWELNLVLAIIHYNLSMDSHAVASVEKALKLNPGEPVVYQWLGRIYLKINEFSKAEHYFFKYTEMVEHPEPEIYSLLGETYLKTNQTEKAYQYFDLALKLDPENNSAAEGIKKASSQLKSGANEN